MKLFALLTGIVALLQLTSCQQEESLARNPAVYKKPKKQTTPVVRGYAAADTICIAAVGDIMLGSAFPDNRGLPPDSAKNSFKRAMKYLSGSDIVFGNLEGSLLDTGMPDSHKKKLESGYLFRMPTYYGKVLKDAGFNLLSVANNHISDFGAIGSSTTTKTLNQNGIRYAGLENCPSTVFERNGIKYGFCAFSPNAHTVSLLDLAHAKHLIRDLKQRCDIVIVSFHGGAEGASYEHVPFKMESYLNGMRGDVHEFAHTAIDAGADVVLGNGPHVSRALEKYKGRLIAYSLGNFCTYKSVSVMGVCGMAPLLKVYLNKKGEFVSGNIISFRQTHERGLQRDPQNHAAARIRLLTEMDFPDAGLDIDDDGSIVPDNDI